MKVLNEQQKCLERLQRNDSRENIFISVIPTKLSTDFTSIPEEDDDDVIEDHKDIIHHILSFLNPNITADSYKIIKNFDPREGYTRHSAKIAVESDAMRSQLFKGCGKFKTVPPDSYLKKVFLKNDDPPLTRRENDRLYKEMKRLRELEDADNPVNKYTLRNGKGLFKNGDECIDEFNLCNQLFQ